MNADHLGATGSKQGSLVAHVSDVIIWGKHGQFLANFHIIFRERIIINVIIGWCIAGPIGRERITCRVAGPGTGSCGRLVMKCEVILLEFISLSVIK